MLGFVVPGHGVALGLGMVFGVGFIAIPIIEIVITGFLHGTARDGADGRPVATLFGWMPRRNTTN